ncbi:MAG TPA: endo-1,3-alpha-glucanase family glycosylhydrolase [Candidatus Bathyarchaeia archaeon]|nr:endo-1,3-alpha-glucanase family glycosylhydrolase [Candidatus Bathyarchaeia archaeon]
MPVSRTQFCRLLPAILFAMLLLSACHRTEARSPLAANSFFEGGAQPTMLAAYMPWFGQPGHINVGYSAQDRVQLEKQVDEAKQLGITAFVVNWYGQHHSFEDKAYSLLQEVAAEKNFKVAILYDEDDSDPAAETDDIIADLQYAYEHYIGPQAIPPRDAYLTLNDRPLIFIFPKGARVDWSRVRQAVSGWQNPPLLIYKDIHPELANDFDGFYAWVNPGKPGWQSDGSNWGQQYLDNFYKTMATDYPNKIAVGAAWPGFNDSEASWSQNRKMGYRCGRTFIDTMRMFRRYYDEQHPLPFLMIETWNDYEEGTAIEKGVPTCK